MELKKSQMFEYALSLFPYFLHNRGFEDIPTYKIVWKIGNDLLTANTYKTNSSNTPITEYVRADGEIATETWSAYKPESDLCKIRTDLFNKYGKSHDSPWALYNNPLQLLQELIKNYSDFDTKEDRGNSILLDVHFLKNNVSLPFLVLPTDVDLMPVSLISES